MRDLYITFIYEDGTKSDPVKIDETMIEEHLTADPAIFETTGGNGNKVKVTIKYFESKEDVKPTAVYTDWVKVVGKG